MEPKSEIDPMERRRVQRWNELSLSLTWLSCGFYSGSATTRHFHDSIGVEGYSLLGMFVGLAAATLIWLVKVRGRGVE
jgi:hypothetical protein